MAVIIRILRVRAVSAAVLPVAAALAADAPGALAAAVRAAVAAAESSDALISFQFIQKTSPGNSCFPGDAVFLGYYRSVRTAMRQRPLWES